MPQMPEGLQGPVQLGEALTVEEQSAVDAVRDAIKNSGSVANDILGKLLTLDAAMIGGGVVIAKGEVFPVWWAAVVMTLLLVSLGAALSGLWPLADKPDPGSCEDVLHFQNRVRESVYRKVDAMRLSAAFLCIALVMAVSGVALRGTGAF
ncbi:MAG TPA: hypothetical protein VD866_25630 [Urbifossiella sp.]|nr:hypothetical protein [Urbifossiella sp.]